MPTKQLKEDFLEYIRQNVGEKEYKEAKVTINAIDERDLEAITDKVAPMMADYVKNPSKFTPPKPPLPAPLSKIRDRVWEDGDKIKDSFLEVAEIERPPEGLEGFLAIFIPIIIFLAWSLTEILTPWGYVTIPLSFSARVTGSTVSVVAWYLMLLTWYKASER